jgi:putative transposase
MAMILVLRELAIIWPIFTKRTFIAHIESFNARLRQECLNAHWFESIEEARRKIRAWQHQYNEEHPHSALGYLTPNAFAKIHANTP